MRLAAFHRDPFCAEGQDAGARRDIDIARPARDRIGANGDLPVGGEAEIQVPGEHARHHAPLAPGEQGRLRGDERGERQAAAPRRRRGRRGFACQQQRKGEKRHPHHLKVLPFFRMPVRFAWVSS
ncbi:MAG: hypothetical protein ACXWVK_11905 [Rhodoplanes sp.]